jgi:hypothetical protein
MLIMARTAPYLQMSNFPASCTRDEIGVLAAYRTKELLQNRRNFCAVDLYTACRIRAKRYLLRLATHIHQQGGFRKKIIASSRFQRLMISVNELFASRELLLSLVHVLPDFASREHTVVTLSNFCLEAFSWNCSNFDHPIINKVSLIAIRTQACWQHDFPISYITITSLL